MSNYCGPRKVVIGRHWKRPKPRIYECNVRDAERFYQECYKDYLQNKEYAARRAAEESEPRYGMHRSNSMLHQRADSESREGLDTALRFFSDDSLKPNSSYRASSVSHQNGRGSPESDLSSVEQKLQRIRKLREDLGLPTETSNDVAYKSSSNRVNIRQTSPMEMRSNEASYSISSTGNQLRGGDSDDSFRTKYSSRNSGSSLDKYGSERNNYASSSTEEFSRPNGKSVSFSSKEDFGSSKRYNKFNDDSAYGASEGTSYKSSKSSSFKGGRKAAAAASSMNDDSLETYDDDEFISNLKKKFVSSNEILERIKKMDDDI